MSAGASRIIRLRRPPRLSRVDGPFVPDAPPDALAEVDDRWSALCAANPQYHDGRLCHVIGVHRNGHGGAVLHVVDCAYRYHAVQDAGFDLGVRPLGVKGITERGGRILLGRRSEDVAAYRGLWEFAPGGVVEPGEAPEVTVVRELREETGLDVRGEPVCLAAVYDDVLRTWELVYGLEAGTVVGEATGEYTELAWCARGNWPGGLSPVAQTMRELQLRA